MRSEHSHGLTLPGHSTRTSPGREMAAGSGQDVCG